MTNDGADVAERLLAFARQSLRSEDLSYTEAPRKLSGGYFTSVFALRFAGVPESWSGPLILRLFPSDIDEWLPRRERAAQQALSSLGFPAPRLVTSEHTEEAIGRRFLLMERMPGRPLMAGAEFPGVVFQLGRILRHVPAMTAQAQASLHALDPTPLVDALGSEGFSREEMGIEEWFARLERATEQWSLDELRPGIRWVRERRPTDRQTLSICHGDLWPGNVMVNRKRITGVIDWSLVTITDPACDVGGTLSGFEQAPVDAPAPLRALIARVGRSLGLRFLESYRKLRDVDVDSVRYWTALRALAELSFQLSEHRRVESGGAAREVMPIWNPAQLAGYFEEVTGVAVRAEA